MARLKFIGNIEAEKLMIYSINRFVVEDFFSVLKIIDNHDLDGILLTTFEKAIEVAGLTSMIEDFN